MIAGIDPTCQFEVPGGVIIDCIPPAERSQYRLWRASAFVSLARNALNSEFILNVGPRTREQRLIHFGNSWRRAFAGAAQIISEVPPRSDLQDTVGAIAELAASGIQFPDNPVMVVFSLDPAIDAKQAFSLQRVDGVHYATDRDVPMSALDPHTYSSLLHAFGHLGLALPEPN